MNISENTTRPYLRFFLLRQGKRNSQIYFHKINFTIVILRVRERNKLPFDIHKYSVNHDRHKRCYYKEMVQQKLKEI